MDLQTLSNMQGRLEGFFSALPSQCMDQVITLFLILGLFVAGIDCFEVEGCLLWGIDKKATLLAGIGERRCN